jgi:hypothetical protein
VQLIQGIRIRDFRSLVAVDLSGFDDIVPVVGANGGGKSNLLRALNLFFNGEVEAGDPLDLGRDFRDPGRQVRQVISIELDLAFGDRLRKELKEPIERFAGGADIVTIRRRYLREPITKAQVDEIAMSANGDEPVALTESDRTLVERLLTSVRFRYLSNHIHPTQVLRSEEQNIRRILFDRLGKSPSFSDEQIKRIQSTAEELMGPVSKEMQQSTGRVGRVQLTTPNDWRDLVWAFGLSVAPTAGSEHPAALHGSGIQSVLAYAVLNMVDSSFSGSFGWRRGTVWAVEEPESFLHADLQAQLARALATYASSDRLQILMSTHSPAFLGAAEHGVNVGMDRGAVAVSMARREELIGLASSSGVLPFAHPLHTGIIKPMLLVEGRDDQRLIRRAYALGEDPCPYEVLCLEDLEPGTGMTGGVEQITTYLKNNQTALKARAATSPIFVLADWEVTDAKLNGLRKALAAHPTSRCERMPRELRNADLSDEFVGIEGFLSTRFYEEVDRDAGLQLTQPVGGAAWKYATSKASLGSAKQQIHRLLDTRKNDDDIKLLVPVTRWVSRLLPTEAQTRLAV